MRILVAGAAGLLGRYVVRAGRRLPGVEVHAWFRRPDIKRDSGQFESAGDARDPRAVERIVENVRPDVVINCIGAVPQRSPSLIDMIAINAWFPHFLATVAAQRSARVIHVSTDAVFDGKRGHYVEADAVCPTDPYGMSKALGEIGPPNLTVRTCFVGRGEPDAWSLLDWLLRQQGEVQGFAESYCSCISAPTLARVLFRLATLPEVTGPLHIGGPRISKFELCAGLLTAFGRQDIHLVAASEPRLDRSLESVRLAGLGVQLPPLRDQWAELAEGANGA